MHNAVGSASEAVSHAGGGREGNHAGGKGGVGRVERADNRSVGEKSDN